jgi:hypothetical protein
MGKRDELWVIWGGDFGGRFEVLGGSYKWNWVVRGKLWHIWKSLRVNYKGGKMTCFKLGTQVHETGKHEINWFKKICIDPLELIM